MNAVMGSGLGLHRDLPDVGDWGGFYDHVVPKRFDAMGYGLRWPVLSP